MKQLTLFDSLNPANEPLKNLFFKKSLLLATALYHYMLLTIIFHLIKLTETSNIKNAINPYYKVVFRTSSII